MAGTDNHYTLYSARIKNDAAPPERHECWVRFPEVKNGFGEIIANWKAKREEFGPGFYLYLGTRRGLSLYREHRFVNLIWGIEALHRKRDTSPIIQQGLQDKIQRILNQIGSKKDQKWLARLLERFAEPSLEQRLFETFSDSPIGLDHARLRDFSVACAKRRNEISHFGGNKHEISYDEFLADIDSKSDALSLLYHALILREIGIDSELLQRRITKGAGSYRNKKILIENGLIDSSSSQ